MKPHKAEGSICFKGTNVTEKNEELPLSDIYVLYHTSPYPGRTSNAAGEQIKLLQENMVSRRIGGHTLLHRYPAVIREIPTVDIIAEESSELEEIKRAAREAVNSFRKDHNQLSNDTYIWYHSFKHWVLVVSFSREVMCAI